MTKWTLAIDTSAGTSVALLHDGELVSEYLSDSPMKHAEVIGDALAQVLHAAGVSARNITTVVAGRGPAPFTGLRVGIAAARLFSEAAHCPLFGAVSLDAIAFAALDAGAAASADRPLLVTADARRKEVYWALYSGRSRGGAPLRAAGPGVLKPDALPKQLAELGFTDYSTTDLPVTAAQLARVVEAQLLDGTEDSDVSALYLREPDAVLPKPHQPIGKRVSG